MLLACPCPPGGLPQPRLVNTETAVLTGIHEKQVQVVAWAGRVWTRSPVVNWTLSGLQVLGGPPGTRTTGTLQGAPTAVASKVPAGFGTPRWQEDSPEEDSEVKMPQAGFEPRTAAPMPANGDTRGLWPRGSSRNHSLDCEGLGWGRVWPELHGRRCA